MPTRNIDLYSILQVERGCTPDDIKRSYRKLARQYHPDVNGADDAAERFKEINLAYEVLSDPQRRQQYDQFGTTEGYGSGSPFEGGGFGSINDIFEFFFGGNFGGFGDSAGRRANARGEDIHRSVQLDLEDCLRDHHESLRVNRREDCETCSGSGSAVGTSPEVCTTCGGRGIVIQVRDTLLGRMQTTTTCHRCHGQGKIITSPCSSCHGSGLFEVVRTIDVTIPAGVDNGNMLRVPGQGHRGRGGGPAGDLLVSIGVREDAQFERDGADLRVNLQVHYSDLVLGATVEVPTLEGHEKLRVPAGTASHHVFTLRGHGLPRLRSSGRGNLYVIVTVAIPQKVGKEQKELLGKLRDEDIAQEKKGGTLLHRLLKRK